MKVYEEAIVDATRDGRCMWGQSSRHAAGSVLRFLMEKGRMRGEQRGMAEETYSLLAVSLSLSFHHGSAGDAPLRASSSLCVGRVVIGRLRFALEPVICDCNSFSSFLIKDATLSVRFFSVQVVEQQDVCVQVVAQTVPQGQPEPASNKENQKGRQQQKPHSHEEVFLQSLRTIALEESVDTVLVGSSGFW